MQNPTSRINISFTKDDYDLFHEIIKESQLTYVPASVHVRLYEKGYAGRINEFYCTRLI